MERKHTILIVDDDEGTRNQLKLLFEDEDYEILYAKDGHNGLVIAETAALDLILLDIVLPGFDGYEVCRRIRANPRLSQIPVLMMTGYDLETSAVKGLEVGADDVITKPFKVMEVKLRVRTILRLNRFRTLQSERSRFTWIVEHSSDGYVALNSQGIITYLNPVASQLLDIELVENEEDKIPFLQRVQKNYQLVTPQIWDKWPELNEKAFLVRPESEQVSAHWLRVDKFDMESSDPGSCVLRLQDESNKMRMQQNMWTFENLVAYKLQTPLNGILSKIEKLCKRVDKGASKEEREL